MKIISGGVCAAEGFFANGIHCGIRKNKLKKDLALVYSPTRCAAACVFTQNLVKGAPLKVTKRNISDGHAKAVVCNSGNANTCNSDGEEKARTMCEITANALNIDPCDVLVASTGVIGQKLDITPIENAFPHLVNGLKKDGKDAAQAIMTTDLRSKEYAVCFKLGEKECILGGMAKGSGMIHPNMATMLVFITTDVAISPQMLQKALGNDVNNSFNMVSIDGDCSTNDMVCLLANGLAENEKITCEGEYFDEFCAALGAVTRSLCRMIAASVDFLQAHKLP
ncbi:MAG TPA: bifunctional ornithine acetyltransferase/N-acetylglutamate synthase, partial [Clostridiales bacterium]|nr:bifunctional ornithine acetyltransferase/N-acetylglutamate synthase [Clostridiales bacterium]